MLKQWLLFSKMRRSLLMTAGVLTAFNVSSCTSFYQKAMDYGAVYEGVVVRDIETCYIYEDKRYVKGHKAQYRRSSTKPPITLFGGDYYENFSLIAGTEGEAVYHVADQGMWPANGHNWVSLPEDKISAESSGIKIAGYAGCEALPGLQLYSYKEREPFSRTFITGERELTAHALYSYPLGVVAGVCVDVPITVISSCVWGGIFLVDQIYLQQQSYMPPPEPTPKAE